MISFVVPAYNEGRLIGRTLAAIHGAARELGEPYELVVVDDASTDRTAAIASACGARVLEVQFRQIARTRNAGAGAARGDTLIFVDADTIVPPGTLRATIDALDRGAVGGGATLAFDGRLPRYAALFLPLFHLAARVTGLACGCYVFCTRRAFDAVGGFDASLYATEEIPFSRSLRRQGRVVILREPVTTSGRKLRTHSVWEVLRLGLALARRGTGVFRSREGLSVWYGDRRDDPDLPVVVERAGTEGK